LEPRAVHRYLHSYVLKAAILSALQLVVEQIAHTMQKSSACDCDEGTA
jgi:hypothetical protein